LSEWQAAVSVAEGVRLFNAPAHTITNSKTGEVISVPVRDGDAEVFFPTENKWYSVFTWFEGSASFAGRFEPGDKSHPVWVAAISLAARLGAVIRGDDGEIYDLETGKVVTR
jgi:hypothetical protein